MFGCCVFSASFPELSGGDSRVLRALDDAGEAVLPPTQSPGLTGDSQHLFAFFSACAVWQNFVGKNVSVER